MEENRWGLFWSLIHCNLLQVHDSFTISTMPWIIHSLWFILRPFWNMWFFNQFSCTVVWMSPNFATYFTFSCLCCCNLIWLNGLRVTNVPEWRWNDIIVRYSAQCTVLYRNLNGFERPDKIESFDANGAHRRYYSRISCKWLAYQRPESREQWAVQIDFDCRGFRRSRRFQTTRKNVGIITGVSAREVIQ